MKKKLISLVLPVIILVSTFSSPLIAHAVTSTTNTTTSASTATTTDAAAARTARLTQYKQKLTTALTDAVKTRVALRCVAAQALVKARSTANTAATTARNTAYQNVTTDLQAFATAAGKNGANVSILNNDIALLQTKITAFKTTNTTYQQDLIDVSELDCKADPTAFQAALQVTRTDQSAVFKAATEVRTYINDVIKPAIVAIKAELAARNSATSN